MLPPNISPKGFAVRALEIGQERNQTWSIAAPSASERCLLNARIGSVVSEAGRSTRASALLPRKVFSVRLVRLEQTERSTAVSAEHPSKTCFGSDVRGQSAGNANVARAEQL